MSKKLQRPISVLTSITTAVWLSGVAMLAPMGAMAAIVDGDIVSPDAEFTEGGVTYYPYDVFIVKIVGSKTFKRLILNPSVFDSYGHLEWGNIQTISASTVEGYTTSDLVREINDTKVYKLTPDGDTGTKQWLNMTAADFVSDGYDWDSIYIINSVDRDAYTTGSDITVGGVVVSEGTLTVALAADTPASGTVVGSAARVPFTKINLTASGGDVIVDSMTLERGGLGQDGAFSSIAVILDSQDGDQLGNNKSLNASHQTVLNDDLTVSNGTTKSIYLVGNMASKTTLASYAGETPTLKLAAMTLKGDASLNATLPITGNYQTVNSTITISTATIADGINAVSASTQKVGVTDYIVTSLKVTNSSAEKITVKKIVFTQNGSASASDVANVDLIKANTGDVLETVTQPTSKTLAFNPNITIDKGKNVSFDLRLDIVDGSARTISYDIDEQTDILVVGETYGYYITPSYTATSRPYYPEHDTTIGDGSLRIESVAVSPTNIAENQSDILLGKFKFVAKGEEVKVTSIGWHVKIGYNTAGTTTTDVTNLTILDANGTAIAGPMDLTYDNGDASYTYGTATTTDTIIFPVGENTYTVEGDLSADFTANDTIQIQVMPSIVTARGMTTDNSITPTPADWVSSTSLTIKAAALTVTVSSDPAAQTVVAGTQNFTFAKYLFDATDSGDNIKVSQVKVPVITTSSAYPDMVTGIELFDGATEISVDNESTDYGSGTGSTAGGSATTTLNLTTGALVISAGTTKVITVKADIGTGVTSGTMKIGIQADGVTASDTEGTTVVETCTANQGQTMTLASGGTLNLSALTDPASALVVAGSSGVAVGKFTLQAKYEDININYLGITLAAPGEGIDANEYDQVQSVALYEDGVAEAKGSIELIAANATITPSATLTIPAGTTKNFTLKATFAALSDVSPAASGAGLKFQLTSLDATGVSAGSSSITVAGLDATFNVFNIFKSVPTVTKLAFSGADTITGNSVVSLYKFKITANSAGPVGLFKLTFGISTTTVSLCDDATDVTKTTGYYLYISDSEGSLGTILSRGGTTAKADMVGTLSGTGGNEAIIETYFDVNDDDSSGTAEEQLIINAGDTKYFTLRGTVKTGHDGTADNESISTVMAGDAAFSHTALERADGTDARGDDDFIWSDLNVDLYSSSTATNTIMYVGGYRVSGLDSTSSTPQTIGD